MKRVLILAPLAFTAADLTGEQAAAISGVFGQWVIPMPGTVAAGGTQVIDALAADIFNPANIAGLGLPFTVIGLWQWHGAGALAEVTALDTDAFLAHLPAVPARDAFGLPTGGTASATLHEPHRWAGWPAAF
jgi:hypothetical protein